MFFTMLITIERMRINQTFKEYEGWWSKCVNCQRTTNELWMGANQHTTHDWWFGCPPFCASELRVDHRTIGEERNGVSFFVSRQVEPNVSFRRQRLILLDRRYFLRMATTVTNQQHQHTSVDCIVLQFLSVSLSVAYTYCISPQNLP